VSAWQGDFLDYWTINSLYVSNVNQAWYFGLLSWTLLHETPLCQHSRSGRTHLRFCLLQHFQTVREIQVVRECIETHMLQSTARYNFHFVLFNPSSKYIFFRPVYTTRDNSFNTLKTSGYYMYHQFNIQQFYVLPPQPMYMFCVDLRTNSDYFPLQL